MNGLALRGAPCHAFLLRPRLSTLGRSARLSWRRPSGATVLAGAFFATRFPARDPTQWRALSPAPLTAGVRRKAVVADRVRGQDSWAENCARISTVRPSRKVSFRVARSSPNLCACPSLTRSNRRWYGPVWRQSPVGEPAATAAANFSQNSCEIHHARRRVQPGAEAGGETLKPPALI